MNEKDLNKCIVKILSKEFTVGTGFWVKENFILSCTHVIENLDPIRIQYGNREAVAKIKRRHGDIALLEVAGMSGTCVSLGTNWNNRDDIYSLGYQYEGNWGMEYFPMEGTILGPTTVEGMEAIALKDSIHVMPGSSGAPALNRRNGEVIGIISHRWEEKAVSFVLSLETIVNDRELVSSAPSESGIMKKIFINYAEEDIKIAERIYDDLKRAGHFPWMKDRDILPGQNRKLEIRKALRSCDYFIPLLSFASVDKRGHLQKEMKMALELLEERPEGDVFVIPVKLDDCEPGYETLHELETVDWFRDGFEKILKTIGGKEPICETESAPVTILHLSDIHLETMDEAEQYRSQLEADLTKRLEVGCLDYLVISGDIGNFSTEDEYKAALGFVEKLSERFGLNSSRIIVSPGNHDINWDLSEESYEFTPTRKLPENIKEDECIPAGKAGKLLRNNDRYKERFRYFSDKFYKKIYGSAYPEEFSNQGILHICPGNHIVFMSLNSCWEIDHHFTGRSSIHMPALTNALDQLDRQYDDWLKIAVWHHPVAGPEMMKNVDFLEQLAVHGFQIVLHGHIHEAIEGYHRYDKSNGIYIVGAGTFGAPVKEQVTGIPLQYNLLKIDPEKDILTVETRRKEKRNGAWSADSRWGDKNDPSPKYEEQLKKTSVRSTTPENRTESPEIFPAICEIPEGYRKWIGEHCRNMDIQNLMEKGRVIQVELPEIFITLFADSPEKKQKQEEPADVEDLISRNDYLLLEGEAGSGKTTLLKHFAYMLIDKKEWKGLKEWLPVLIWLKDLKGFPVNDISPCSSAAEKILEYHIPRNGLDLKTVKAYAKAGRCIFLLDGLDEIDSRLRDVVADAFGDFCLHHEGCKAVLSGRPHGISGKPASRFGKKHTRILALNMEQVEFFITRWFQCVYDKDSRIGKETADDMIEDVKVHENIERLIDNPLMLTTICILYHDGRKLPGQRAELYKKFTTNLIYRRFSDPENVKKFMMRLALKMHTDKVKGIDRSKARKVLENIHPKNKEEPDEAYRERLDSIFDEMEPKSGLLMKDRDRGEYSFQHLTFQEFFAAVALVDGGKDYAKAIQGFWGGEWYREMIELFIGYLSMENRLWANDIVREKFEQKDNAPFYHWRLAGWSLLDIHPKTRKKEVVDLAVKKLFEVAYDSGVKPKIRAEAGEIIGWLGDIRDLEAFVTIPGGTYKLSTGKFKTEEFQISRYPVTNQWYAKFVEDKGYEKKEYWSEEGWRWVQEEGCRVPRYWYQRRWNCPNAPVVGVSWYEACAFASWLNSIDEEHQYRLLHENEWEAAAAGKKGREYPWGEGIDKSRCNYGENVGKTSAVGIFQSGDSPDGVSDLAGNVWEWCENRYSEGGSFRVYRGGGWDDNAVGCRTSGRGYRHPGFRYRYIGFRLHRTV